MGINSFEKVISRRSFGFNLIKGGAGIFFISSSTGSCENFWDILVKEKETDLLFNKNPSFYCLLFSEAGSNIQINQEEVKNIIERWKKYDIIIKGLVNNSPQEINSQLHSSTPAPKNQANNKFFLSTISTTGKVNQELISNYSRNLIKGLLGGNSSFGNIHETGAQGLLLMSSMDYWHPKSKQLESFNVDKTSIFSPSNLLLLDRFAKSTFAATVTGRIKEYKDISKIKNGTELVSKSFDLIGKVPEGLQDIINPFLNGEIPVIQEEIFIKEIKRITSEFPQVIFRDTPESYFETRVNFLSILNFLETFTEPLVPNLSKSLSQVKNAILSVSDLAREFKDGLNSLFSLTNGYFLATSSLLSFFSNDDSNSRAILGAIEYMGDLLKEIQSEIRNHFYYVEANQLRILSGIQEILEEVRFTQVVLSNKLDALSADINRLHNKQELNWREEKRARLLRTINQATRIAKSNKDLDEIPSLQTDLFTYATVDASSQVFTSYDNFETFKEVNNEILSKRNETDLVVGLFPVICAKLFGELTVKSQKIVNPIEWNTAVQAYLELSFVDSSIPVNLHELKELYKTGLYFKNSLLTICSYSSYRKTASLVCDFSGFGNAKEYSYHTSTSALTIPPPDETLSAKLSRFFMEFKDQELYKKDFDIYNNVDQLRDIPRVDIFPEVRSDIIEYWQGARRYLDQRKNPMHIAKEIGAIEFEIIEEIPLKLRAEYGNPTIYNTGLLIELKFPSLEVERAYGEAPKKLYRQSGGIYGRRGDYLWHVYDQSSKVGTNAFHVVEACSRAIEFFINSKKIKDGDFITWLTRKFENEPALPFFNQISGIVNLMLRLSSWRQQILFLDDTYLHFESVDQGLLKQNELLQLINEVIKGLKFSKNSEILAFDEELKANLDERYDNLCKKLIKCSNWSKDHPNKSLNFLDLQLQQLLTFISSKGENIT